MTSTVILNRSRPQGEFAHCWRIDDAKRVTIVPELVHVAYPHQHLKLSLAGFDHLPIIGIDRFTYGEWESWWDGESCRMGASRIESLESGDLQSPLRLRLRMIIWYDRWPDLD